MRAIRFHAFGTPDVLSLEEVPDPQLTADSVLIKVAAAGVSYADIQMRSGVMKKHAWFPSPPLPFGPGFEVAGTVVEVGANADPSLVGRRVVSGLPTAGGYAELAVVPAAAVYPLPDGIDEHTALALHGQGATAVGIVESANLSGSEIVLVEAAGGGVGSVIVQLAKNAGAKVVAAASTEDKLAAAKQLGADTVVNYSEESWHEQIRKEYGKVDVVFEAVGGDTSRKALDLLAIGTGKMVLYGTASGELPEFSPLDIYMKGFTVTSFGPRRHVDPAYGLGLRDKAFQHHLNGSLHPLKGLSAPLWEAAAVHSAIENRAAKGKSILIP
ncbi:quinone oxidoreductase family protein [Nocardia lijiangensis]|uniref:quinone oxidoreductase family protein n=1 Tax=Nocardia lijiangensis TaxID=299618 RepID=UPI0008350981|nr:zinc-binding dehydrogenase [Nocardia lijiangensis]